MSNKDNKLPFILGLGAAAGLIALATRKPAPEEPGESTPDVSVTIQLFDSAGNPIVRHSPYALPEGDLVTLQVTGTNKSRKVSALGEITQIPLNFILSIHSQLDNGTVLIPGMVSGDIGYWAPSMAAGATGVIATVVFRVPWGTQGMSGYLSIRAIFPDNTKKDAMTDVTVVGAQIIYDIDFTFI